MAKRARGNRKGNRREKPPAWQFFPIYGVRIDDDDGLHAPIWGDATLISRDNLTRLVQHGAEAMHPLLVHGKVSEALDLKELDSIGNMESLVEIVPKSYVAVRHRSSNEASQRRANRVRALLNATLFLRGKRATAFCGDSREYAWFLSAQGILVEPRKKVEASLRPFVNPNIVQRDLHVSKESLRRSVKYGTPIEADGTSTWDIHEKHAVCTLLNSSKQSKFEERLVGAALLTQDAACTPSEFSKLQMAVTAVERVLNTSSYQLLERRARCFVVSERPNIQTILAKRHELTHEGRTGDEQAIADVAQDAVALAWLLFDVATAFSEHFNGEQFDRYVDALAVAHEIDSTVAALLGRSDYSEHVKLLHASLAGKRARPTLVGYNIQPASESST